MYKILKAEKLAANIYLMDVEAPRVARHCEPGQFVIVKMDEKGERIPSRNDYNCIPAGRSIYNKDDRDESRRLFPRFHRTAWMSI